MVNNNFNLSGCKDKFFYPHFSDFRKKISFRRKNKKKTHPKARFCIDVKVSITLQLELLQRYGLKER